MPEEKKLLSAKAKVVPEKSQKSGPKCNQASGAKEIWKTWPKTHTGEALKNRSPEESHHIDIDPHLDFPLNLMILGLFVVWIYFYWLEEWFLYCEMNHLDGEQT